MQLRPEEIRNIIKEQITHYQSQIKLTDVGTVVTMVKINQFTMEQEHQLKSLLTEQQ